MTEEEEKRVALTAKATRMAEELNLLYSWQEKAMREAGLLEDGEEFDSETAQTFLLLYLFVMSKGETEEDAKRIALGIYAPSLVTATIMKARSEIAKARVFLDSRRRAGMPIATTMEAALKETEARLARHMKVAKAWGLKIEEEVP